MSEPPSPNPGNISGNSYLKNLNVIREDLVIRLQELKEKKTAKVRATYKIYCPELLRNIDLIFVANNLTESRYRVEIDGKFVNGYLKQYDSIPENWLPPDSILFLGKNIPYIYKNEGLISFRFDSLTPGIHQIIVDYDAEVSEWFDYGDKTVINTFVYILKPTENWSNFENFHLEVFIPDDWEFSSNLKLRKVNAYLFKGDWDKLPANFLSIAVRKSPNDIRGYSTLFTVFSWLIFIVLIIYLMIRCAKYRILNNKGLFYYFLISIGFSFLASVFLFFIYFQNIQLIDYWQDYQTNPLLYHGSAYTLIAFPIIWFISAIIILVIDLIIIQLIKKNQERKKS